MNLSRKNKRNLKRLRKDAAKLWAEQQSVNERAAVVFGKARSQAVDFGQSELVPAVKGAYDKNVRPGLANGLAIARDVADDARIRFDGRVLPAFATVLGSVAGGLQHAAKSDALPSQLKGLDFKGTAKSAKQTSKELQKRAKAAMKDYDRKNGGGGLGVGGWVLVGTGAAVLAAVGYALWQTFRADDDLWIADDELDAPVTTVKPKETSAPANSASANNAPANNTPANNTAATANAHQDSTLARAAERGIATSNVDAKHVAGNEADSAPSIGR